MTADSAGTFLYGSDFDAGAVRAYAIQASTGELTEIDGSPFSSPLLMGNGGPIAVSPDGKFVFFSDSIGDITTFSTANGALSPGASVLQDMNQPNQFAVDPSGSFLYVANLSDFDQAQFSVFAIAPTTAVLTPASGSPFLFQGNSGPFGIVVHPSGNFLYSTLSNAAGVDALAVNRTTGSLALVQGSPWTTWFAPENLAMDPSGKFLYVDVAGVGSLVAFTVDPTTGALTQSGSYDANGKLAIDPSGKFLYVSEFLGLNMGQIVAFQIDQSTGALSPVPGSPFMAGADPGALAIVQLH